MNGGTFSLKELEAACAENKTEYITLEELMETMGIAPSEKKTEAIIKWSHHAHSIRNPGTIHMLVDGHYICNGAVAPTPSKSTDTIGAVTCKNCKRAYGENIFVEPRPDTTVPRKQWKNGCSCNGWQIDGPQDIEYYIALQEESGKILDHMWFIKGTGDCIDYCPWCGSKLGASKKTRAGKKK